MTTMRCRFAAPRAVADAPSRHAAMPFDAATIFTFSSRLFSARYYYIIAYVASRLSFITPFATHHINIDVRHAIIAHGAAILIIDAIHDMPAISFHRHICRRIAGFCRQRH